MTDHEMLIREAIAAEAARAVHPGAVLAELEKKRARRRPMALIAAGGLTAVAAAVALVVPLTMGRGTPPSPDAAAQSSAAVSPTAQNVLVFGLDEDGYTDSIALTRFGGDGSISAVSIPRDTWIETPGGTVKANSVYRGAGSGVEGSKALVTAVEAMAGVRIDHYAAVDMTAFTAVNDAVGGVEVCLRNATEDDYSGADFPAGRQVLTSDQALAFVRQRHGLPQGDLDRVVRQQAFLHAAAAKALAAPDTLPALVGVVREHVRVDEGWDVLALARGLRPDAPVRTATIPVGEQTSTERGTGLSVDPAAVRAFVGEFLVDAPAGGAPGGDGCVA
ncbi:LCP family protein [Saccharothrix coeruleofusca]|uniref:Cell envelope-related transcriptional attenuator domain-containing protein n=1 Tax=Saccharothrix coeruleofusca TaxID=33919 RepID=A0A918EHZ0_9PSEU|nr:LCP family protein [Saccharothrix coeruleofusca]MBP2338895.1 LCP family protein required for cell wall assembly [Saccharothrix coeruleofusca]GGP86147.1 hypothetical protein GCM10010185_69840 [Saccharothrix coeruleofusca]